MRSIAGVYEVVIRVRDLARAEAFYREVLELEEGLRVPDRGMLFLRVGDRAGMLVLQQDAGEWPTQHFAFGIADADLDAAARTLRARGVDTVGPVTHAWMPARSLYFEDPDGHDLELCAALPATAQEADGRWGAPPRAPRAGLARRATEP